MNKFQKSTGILALVFAILGAAMGFLTLGSAVMSSPGSNRYLYKVALVPIVCGLVCLAASMVSGFRSKSLRMARPLIIWTAIAVVIDIAFVVGTATS